MLSTIQIAITTIGIFAGAFGGATIAKHFEAWLSQYQFIATYSEAISIAIVVIPLTYFSLVIGELIPKQIALSNPEKLALRASWVIIIIMKVTTPLVKLLSISTTWVLKLLRIEPAKEHIVTEEEIKLLIAEGVENGAFEKAELKMVENIFQLWNRPIKDFMTLNEEIYWIDINDPISVIEEKILTQDITIFPVCKGDKNHPIWAIETNDILNYSLSQGSNNINLKSLLHPIIYIDSNMPSLVAIDRLQKSSIRIALIYDKMTNKVLGVISFHDILEAIVWEFQIKQQ